MKQSDTSAELTTITPHEVEAKIIKLRNQPIIIDSDVAELYGVQTKEVNQAVKNNPHKFPEGYIFEISNEEKAEVVKNFDHLQKVKFRPTLPYAFTEKGLYMLATILKSEQAVNTTIAIIETFAQVRSLKRELVELHQETDKQKQAEKMKHFGKVLTDIVMPDMQTSETESTLELNFIIGKIKHTVKRVRKEKP